MSASSAETADVIWGRCVAALERQLSADEMDLWIRPLQPEITNTGLRLFAANSFGVDAVREQYLRQIQAALPASTQIEVRVGARRESNAAARDKNPLRLSDAQPETSVTKVPTKPTRVSEPGYLPFMWGEASRAIPSSLVRCALFTVNTYGPEASRPKRNHSRISSQRNLSVYVTGEETNIFDRDVLMQLLQYQRRFKVGDRFSFSARQVLQDMGLPTGGSYTKKLLASIKRLRSTALELHEQDARGGAGKFGEFNLINEFFRDETAGASHQNWVISFNQTVADMMGKNALTLLIWEQSQRLNSALAKGLHGYYASHNPPYAVSVSFLREITGSNIKDLFKFRKSLKDALDELKAQGFLESWQHIRDGDLIAVVRAKIRLDRAAGGD